jgi:hypothetical protein
MDVPALQLYRGLQQQQSRTRDEQTILSMLIFLEIHCAVGAGQSRATNLIKYQ